MTARDKSRFLSLVELQDLARQPSRENWQFLLRGLTDHFLIRPDVHVDQYGDAFSDIVLRILDRVAVEARAELSERIAPLEKFPKRIVTRLAHDDIPVAHPVLEQSPILSDSDLIAIAGAVMQEHQIAISRRKSLGPRLTEALVRFDIPEVIREVVGNPGARFSDSTFRMVAERAKRDEALQECLIGRTDIAPAIAVQINPFLSPELKARLAANAPKEEKGLLESLSDLTREEKKKNAFAPDPEMAKVMETIAQIRAGKAELSRVVADFADLSRMSALSAVLCEIGRLTEKTVHGALVNPNGMPIAVICRGLGLSHDAFEAIAHLRGRHLTLPQADTAGQVDRYGNLDPDDARKTLAVLQAKKMADSDAA